jgi:hypothetical protein
LSVWRVRDHYYDRKKKDTVVCLACSRSLLRPENIKVPVVCLAGARLLLRPEKKDTVVCLAGARSLLRPEKKKKQSSVWRVRDRYYDRKNKKF